MTREEQIDWKSKLVKFELYLKNESHFQTESQFIPWFGLFQLSKLLQQAPTEGILPVTGASFRPMDLPIDKFVASNMSLDSWSGVYLLIQLKQYPGGRDVNKMWLYLVVEPRFSQGQDTSNMNDTTNSPFERCSPRYHLSQSPSWYRGFISQSNPLHYLTPLPIQSSSAPQSLAIRPSSQATQHQLEPSDTQSQREDWARDDDSASLAKIILPPLRKQFLDLSLDWPPLSDENAIPIDNS